MEANEGRLVRVRDVEIDRSTGENFPNNGANVTLTAQSGETFTLRIDARVADILGQPKPAGLVEVIGVLAQFDNSNPRNSGYQVIPSRYADILTPLKPAAVTFVNRLADLVRPGDAEQNRFTENPVRPGESLTTEVTIADPEGRTISVTPLATGLPTGAQWTFSALSGTNLTATFTYTGNAADEGKAFTVGFDADNGSAVNEARWTVYVPTATEQQVVITEFLANPTATSTNAHFNPLGRLEIPTESITLYDEFIELVNLSGTTVDLVNWSLSDSLNVRHRFYVSTPLVSSNAAVVYGGPLNGFLPSLPDGVYSEPASEGAGVALNNDGDTIVLRNADGNIVSRIVYSGTDLAPDGSVHRGPNARGTFQAHRALAADAAWSPGTQPDGKAWTEPQPPDPPSVIDTTIAALRALLDPVNYTPPASPQLYRVEGIVTTHVSLTGSANGLFYLQDDTGGIAVFHSGAARTVPAAGEGVRITAPLGHFNGLLQLTPSTSAPETSVEIVSTDHPLPEPVELDPAGFEDPVRMEANEGRRVILRQVEIDRSTGDAFPGNGSNITVTTAGGQTFTLRLDSRVTEILNQPKPAGPVDIIGVLSQFDTSDPRTSGYQILPTRLADIIGGEEPIEVRGALASDGSLTLTWNTTSGRTYRVTRSGTLDGDFVMVTEGLTDGTFSVPTDGAAGFFRVEAR